jgi:hypothetical protein
MTRVFEWKARGWTTSRKRNRTWVVYHEVRLWVDSVEQQWPYSNGEWSDQRNLGAHGFPLAHRVLAPTLRRCFERAWHLVNLPRPRPTFSYPTSISARSGELPDLIMISEVLPQIRREYNCITRGSVFLIRWTNQRTRYVGLLSQNPLERTTIAWSLVMFGIQDDNKYHHHVLFLCSDLFFLTNTPTLIAISPKALCSNLITKLRSLKVVMTSC